jgi:hypothetical protein
MFQTGGARAVACPFCTKSPERARLTLGRPFTRLPGMDNFEWTAGVRQPLRAGVRGFQNPEAHAQAERVLLSRDHQAKRCGMSGDRWNEKNDPAA